MNKEEIDKWLDENEGMSYTKLEELHDWLADERYKKGKEIERLNNIIKLKTDFIHDLLEIIYYSDDTPLHSKAHLIGEEYEDKLKELKEKSDI